MKNINPFSAHRKHQRHVIRYQNIDIDLHFDTSVEFHSFLIVNAQTCIIQIKKKLMITIEITPRRRNTVVKSIIVVASIICKSFFIFLVFFYFINCCHLLTLLAISVHVLVISAHLICDICSSSYYLFTCNVIHSLHIYWPVIHTKPQLWLHCQNISSSPSPAIRAASSQYRAFWFVLHLRPPLIDSGTVETIFRESYNITHTENVNGHIGTAAQIKLRPCAVHWGKKFIEDLLNEKFSF